MCFDNDYIILSQIANIQNKIKNQIVHELFLQIVVFIPFRDVMWCDGVMLWIEFSSYIYTYLSAS